MSWVPRISTNVKTESVFQFAIQICENDPKKQKNRGFDEKKIELTENAYINISVIVVEFLSKNTFEYLEYWKCNMSRINKNTHKYVNAWKLNC